MIRFVNDSWSYPPPTITKCTIRLQGQPPNNTCQSLTLQLPNTQSRIIAFEGTNLDRLPEHLSVAYGPAISPLVFPCALQPALTTATRTSCHFSRISPLVRAASHA